MDLKVTLKGQCNNLVLKNPVIAASGTFGSGPEYSPFGNLASLGGISVKGISLKRRDGNPSPRIVETACGMLNSVGLQNDGVNYFIEKRLPLLPWRETAIIANIYGSSAEEYGELAAILNEAEGIAALEVNVSCPNVKAGGMLFGADPDLCSEVTASVRKNASNKHVIVKLSPNVTNLAEIAKSAEGAGADSLSCINTLSGMAINPRTRKPLLASITGGLSGPAIKPVALRCVWQAFNAVKIPVIGLGGICSAFDIVEFLLAGASAIQIGTANFMEPDRIFRILEELPGCLQECGAATAAELTGALQAENFHAGNY